MDLNKINDNIKTHPICFLDRFNFDNNMVTIIKNFAKTHQYDDIDSYKEAWEKWISEFSDEINRETERLIGLGYEGNVLEKMYKSGRYYFRNKSNVKKKPRKRRPYIAIDYSIIVLMDSHINDNINSNDFTPAYGYNMFCNKYIDNLKNEIIRLKKLTNKLDKDDLINKIKKTYKNRYFIASRK